MEFFKAIQALEQVGGGAQRVDSKYISKKIGQGAPENSSSKENRQIRIFCYKYMIMVFFSSKVYPKLHNQHFNLTPVVTGGGEIHTPYVFFICSVNGLR